jgi:hypothetical protein
MRLIFTTFIAAFLTVSQLLTAQTSDGWALKNDKDGIKVYYKKTADVQEVKLVTSIQSSLSGIIQLFSEVDNYPKWGYKVVSSQLLKRVSDNEMYYHSKLDFPWPMEDRDVVMHTRLEQDPKSKAVYSHSTSVSTYIPAEKDYIRIVTSNTKWTLIPGPGGWVYVEYYIYSNPGGSIPEWLVNLAIDVGPRETIKNIKTMLQYPKYKNVKLAFIKE